METYFFYSLLVVAFKSCTDKLHRLREVMSLITLIIFLQQENKMNKDFAKITENAMRHDNFGMKLRKTCA